MNSRLLNKLGTTKEDAITSFLFYGGSFSAGFMSSLLGIVIAIMQEEYGIDYATSGMFLSLHQIGSFCACIIAGFLPTLVGIKRTALIMYPTICIGLVMLCSSSIPAIIAISFFMMGIGRSAQGNIGNVIAGLNFKNSTAGLNLLHSSYALGAFISPFLTLLFPRDKWKIPLLINALMMFVIVFFLSFRKQRDKIEKEDEEIESNLKWWTDVDYWLNIAIIFFYQCVEYSLISWMVTYFVNENILSETLSSAMPSILWAAMLISRLYCVFVSDKYKKENMILIMITIIIASYAFMLFTENGYAVVALLFIVGLGLGGLNPTTFSTMKKEFLANSKAMGIGISITALGAIIMPSVIGMLSTTYGLNAGMMSILGAMAFLLILIIIKRMRAGIR